MRSPIIAVRGWTGDIKKGRKTGIVAFKGCCLDVTKIYRHVSLKYVQLFVVSSRAWAIEISADHNIPTDKHNRHRFGGTYFLTKDTIGTVS